MARVLIIGSYADSLLNFRGPLLLEMVRHGHEVVACAPDASPEIQANLATMGVSYRNIYMNRTGMNLFQDVKTLFSLREVVAAVKPDVFFGYTIKPVIYGSIAAHFLGVPDLYSMITGLGYTFIATSRKQRILSLMIRKMYRMALGYNKGIFFQNQDDRSLFVRMGTVKNERKTVIVNGSGVDLSHFAPESFPGTVSFLLIARLLREKGIYEYIEAARTLKIKYPEAYFRLVGWCDDAPSAVSEKELHSWQEEGVVDYLGKLVDVRPALGDTSVYVLPSYREGTPRTVLEAMAMGRPVITSDAPGCRETVLEGENGFLVPVRDADSLAAAMEKFIRQPELIREMGAKSRKLAEDKYNVHMVNQLMLREMNLLRESSVCND